MNTTRPGRPRVGWRQMGRDLGYLLPGMPIAVVSFALMLVGFVLGIGLVVLAFLGLVVLSVTLLTARGFAAAERARVATMEGREVGPFYHPPERGSGVSRLLRHLRDPQNWRDWGFCVLILPVRLVTWPLTVAWFGFSVAMTPIIVGSWAISGGGGFRGLVWLLA
ncbi:sensor domain-containing protein, partial [Phytoactinopolyspora endophytica]|uniref:sensor domain-containing protein n=1 Tax=Phytoactinopolyspora endophytica TaxID=1642495 RepID=UPI00197B47E1